MGMIWGHGGQLEIYIYREREIKIYKYREREIEKQKERERKRERERYSDVMYGMKCDIPVLNVRCQGVSGIL